MRSRSSPPSGVGLVMVAAVPGAAQAVDAYPPGVTPVSCSAKAVSSASKIKVNMGPNQPGDAVLQVPPRREAQRSVVPLPQDLQDPGLERDPDHQRAEGHVPCQVLRQATASRTPRPTLSRSRSSPRPALDGHALGLRVRCVPVRRSGVSRRLAGCGSPPVRGRAARECPQPGRRAPGRRVGGSRPRWPRCSPIHDARHLVGAQRLLRR